MNCPKCGAQNMDRATFCGNCGARIEYPEAPRQSYYNEASYNQPSSQTYQPPYASHPTGDPYSGGMIPPKNYLTEAIIVTIISVLCCCSPISIVLGIIAIVKANNVNSEFESGNRNEAIRNADAAKNLTIWAAVVAVVCYVALFIISIATNIFASYFDILESLR
ncbi:MAG: CD225/dispanin family protein [Tannerella sp.]|jgi:uncharacterized membrane protein YvbJ|nr:CD225/dispanin family protein [Tannerella sp.]